ncbi:MAG: hypothetical protein WEC33_00835 [Dehalococcoidia bacterium]
MTSAKTSCSVCHQPFLPHTDAFCNFSSRPYHLIHRQHLPGDDCGEVWINEEHLGLEFACNLCLHPAGPAEGGLADVLTLDEAAELTGSPVRELEDAAAGGTLPHRKTAAGVYLFERAALMAYRSESR